MQWDDMRVFLAVARFESLSEAGRQLKVDPATVGRRVGRLEEDIGMPLFAKSPQGYALTEAGLRLLDRAEQAEQALIAAKEDLSGQSESLSGQIRIGAPDGCANFLLPQVCAQISKDNPDLDIQILALPRVVNLSKREADMVIAVSPPKTGRVLSQKITDYRLHLAAHRRYLKTMPKIESLSDLKSHRVVGYIQDMIFDKELDYLGEIGVDQVDLASNSASVQFNWIKGQAGIGIVHDFALAATPRLQRVLVDQMSLSRSFYLVRHEDDRKLDRMNRFADALVAGVRDEVQRLEAMVDAP